jgi:hypothetical protein
MTDYVSTTTAAESTNWVGEGYSAFASVQLTSAQMRVQFINAYGYTVYEYSMVKNGTVASTDSPTAAPLTDEPTLAPTRTPSASPTLAPTTSETLAEKWVIGLASSVILGIGVSSIVYATYLWKRNPAHKERGSTDDGELDLESNGNSGRATTVRSRHAHTHAPVPVAESPTRSPLVSPTLNPLSLAGAAAAAAGKREGKGHRTSSASTVVTRTRGPVSPSKPFYTSCGINRGAAKPRRKMVQDSASASVGAPVAVGATHTRNRSASSDSDNDAQSISIQTI